MIESTIRLPRRQLFASIALTEEEGRRLDLLVRECRYFASIAKKTGLHVAHEERLDGLAAVAFSLNRPAELSPEETAFVSQTLHQMKGNHV